jgi:hypothetical protein
VRAFTGSPGLFFFASTGCVSAALIVEFVAELTAPVAGPREFVAEAEFTVLFSTCAPLLPMPAEESPAREVPSAALPAVLVSCCADSAPEEVLPACTPFPRLALAAVLLDADALARASVCGCDCAIATPEEKITARIRNLARFIDSSL